MPETAGRPAFTPSAASTLAVALALTAAAVLIAAPAGLLQLPVPAQVTDNLVFGLALVLLVRAVGDFRLVGFFKRVRDTRFARLDTAVYSPLCLALAVAVFIVGWSHTA